MNIVVREYNDKDLNYVNEVLEEAFSIKKKNFNIPNYYEIVLEVDNKVIGYTLLTKIFNPISDNYYIHVDYVCIKSDFRGKKLGYYLMNYIDEVAKKEKVKYLELSSNRKRIAARGLYEKCGYIKRDSDIFRKEFI